MSTATAAAQSLRDLINTIQDTHHAFLRNELPLIEKQIAALASRYGHKRPDLFHVQQKVQDLAGDLVLHLRKEEQILFPYVAALEDAEETGRPAPSACFASVRFPIRMMHLEHDNASDLLAELGALTDNYRPPEVLGVEGSELYSRLAALDSDLEAHIRTENEELFPRAILLEEMQQS